MRSIEPRADADHIMNIVRGVLSDTSANPFTYQGPSQAQIISGEEESVYKWVALNYLEGVLDEDSVNKQTYGVMEMGGGSLQIAFLPERQPLAEEYAVTLAGRKFSLYVHSYLGYGSNGIVERMTDDLDDGTVDGSVDLVKTNPCFLLKDTKTMTLTTGETVKYIGSGNADLCKDSIVSQTTYSDLRDYDDYCHPGPCAIFNTYQPEISQSMPFYAMGGFQYALEDFDLLNDDMTFDDIPLLGNKSSEYCPLTVDKAKAQLPGKPEQFLSNTCLLGEYVQIVLGDRGLGPFGPNVKVTSKVKGVSAEWTLGALVVHQYEKLSGVESARNFGYGR